MRVGLQTWGSEGDVRPFLALAEGLAARGHEVRLAYAPVDGRAYDADLAGCGFAHEQLSLGLAPEALHAVATEIFADTNPVRQLDRTLAALFEPALDALLRSAAPLARWADVLVSHMIVHPLFAAGEREQKPVVGLYTAPMIPTRALPPPGLPSLGPLNVVAWRLALFVLSRRLTPSVLRVRRALGLPPVARLEEQLERSALDLVAVSPTLLPRPADWPARAHVIGGLSPRQDPRPLTPELERFLDAGAAPVYVGFGSMAAAERDGRAVVRILEQAVALAGVRAIVQSEQPMASSERILHVRASPHDLVFRRCAAVVHHGGAGTTRTALRAGRPAVVVAHMSDQLMWARLLERLGVAPRALTRRRLRAENLAAAIVQVTRDARMAERAAELGIRMQREDGVAAAVSLLDGLHSSRRDDPGLRR